MSLTDTTPRIKRFVTGPLMDKVTALEVNEPRHATMESLEIMLACGGSVIKADINASTAQEISSGQLATSDIHFYCITLVEVKPPHE